MFEDFALWFAGGIATLILGQAGGVWVGTRGLVAQIKQDRIETRDWLKSLETKTNKNIADIAVLDERTKDA